MSTTTALRALSLSTLLSAPALAQWSSDANQNFAVADRTGEQVLPKLASDPFGNTWIGWFDHASGNYDVYVQFLHVDGQEQLPHNGVLVSSHPSLTSITDWDLLSTSNGDCVVVFSDARGGSDLDVHAYRLDVAGNQLWGANGVTLSNNADFEPAPNVCQTSDGSFVFVWMRSPTSGDNTIRIQKLDAAGNPLYPAEGLAITGAAGEDPAFCDVVPADAGGYIVQWLRSITTFSSPRHIHARKYDAAGSPLWPAFVPVFDAGPVPIAYQPIVQPDGAGGAYFCWHRSLGGAYDSLVQHLDASGTELFPHNGVSVSDEAGRWELEPSLCVPLTGEIFVAFNKRDPGQSSWGVGLQKLSAAGVPQFGVGGLDLAPFDAVNESFQRCVSGDDNGVVVAWFEQPTAMPQKRILAQHVDMSGTQLWVAGGRPVCSNLSSKDDLEVIAGNSWSIRAAWQDLRNDGGDVYAQNVNNDGTLGNFDKWQFPYCAGDGVDPLVTTACPCNNFGNVGRGCASSFNPNGAGLDMHGTVAGDDLVLDGSGMNATGNCIFLKGDTGAPAGIVFGDGVRCADGTLIRLRTKTLAAGAASFPDSTDTITLSARGGTPPGSGLLGVYAVYYRNAAAAFCPPETFNVSNGRLVIW